MILDNKSTRIPLGTNYGTAGLLALVFAAVTVAGCANQDSYGTNSMGMGTLDGRATGAVPRPMSKRELDSAIRALEQAGDLRRAAALAQRTARGRPKDVKGWATAGRLLKRTGELDAARAAYERAVDLDQRNSETQIGLAQVSLLQRDYDSALRYFESAAERAPKDLRVWIGSGVVRDALGRHAEAQDFYHRALAIDPGNRAVASNLEQSVAMAANVGTAGDDQTSVGAVKELPTN